MKIDLNETFKTLEGEEVKERIADLDKDGNPKRDLSGFPLLKQGDTFTLKKACCEVLGSAEMTRNPRTGELETVQITGEEKQRRWNLAQEIYKASRYIELEAEDIVLLKRLIDKRYPAPGTYAQACEALKEKGVKETIPGKKK